MSNNDKGSMSPGSLDQKDQFLAGFTVPSGVSLPNSQSYVLQEEIVEVKFTFSSERFVKMIGHYFSLIEEIAVFDFGADTCDITRDEFTKYMNTILYSRIAYVRKRADLGDESYVVGPTDPVILIPDLLKCIINHIGIVRDTEQGLIFHPVLDVDSSELESATLTKLEMENVAAKLRKYQRAGVTMWTQYHRQIEGCVDFMGFTLIEGRVLHYLPKKSFTKALLSSIMGITGIDLVIRPRHYYGEANKMDLYLAGLIQRKSAT